MASLHMLTTIELVLKAINKMQLVAQCHKVHEEYVVVATDVGMAVAMASEVAMPGVVRTMATDTMHLVLPVGVSPVSAMTTS